MRKRISRRQFAFGTGTVATGALAGIAFGTQNATATVSGDFTIPNGETVLADTSLQDIRLSVDTSWSFNSNADIHAVELELHVGSTTDTLDLIARHTQDDMAKQDLTGSQTLNGSLMSASDFSISDFEPTSGELRKPVIAELRMYVLRNDEVVAEAFQTETFDVITKDEALTVDMSLGGTGEIEFTTG